MEFFPNRTDFVTIFGFSIKWYAVLACIGGVACYLLSSKLLRKAGMKEDQIDDITIGCVLFGLIGARLYYCLFYNPSYYFSNPWALINIHNGGLAIHGGLIGASLFGLIYAKRNHLSLLRAMDCILPNVLLSQAIGRWGNFINQEAFGDIVSADKLAFLPQFIQDGMFIDGFYRQPMFLVESVMDLCGFILIVFVMTKFFTLKRGDRTYFYLMWYGISRFIVEIFRTDALMFGSLKMAQVVSLVFIVVGLLGYLGVYDKFIHQQKPTVLFDFDGTLVDTSAAIGASMEKTLDKHNLKGLYTDSFKKDMLGPRPKDLFAKYCPDCDALAMEEEYREFNWEDQKQYNRLFDGTIELLDQLKNDGYRLGVVSTKSRKVLEFGLEMFNMQTYFDVVVGGDEVKKGKPDPEGVLKACKLLKASKDNAVYIGDSVNDIKAGKNAGMFTIAYCSCDAKKDDLAHECANETISNILEVMPILSQHKIFTMDGR